MKDKIKKIFNIEFFVILIYMVLTYITLLHHEPWFDEAQSWMIAKDLDVFGIISQMKFEGHSALWSLILRFFVKLGFNYNIQNVLAWFLSVLGVIFFMYKVNISKWVKVPLLFSVGFLYYCSVFARPYVLMMVLFFLLMYYYDKRYQHPYIVSFILLLLINTHLMIMGFIGALFLIEFYGLVKHKDKIKERTILIVSMIVGVLIFFLQIVGAIYYRNDIVSARVFVDYIYAFIALFEETFGNYSSSLIGSLLAFFMYLYLVYLLKDKDKENFFILCFSLIFYILLSTLVYYLNEFKHFLIILFLLFSFRNLFYDNKIKKLFCFFGILGLYSGIHSIILDYKDVYSNEVNIYKDFVNNDLTNSKIISFGELTVLSMYCDDCEIYNVNVDKFATFDPYVNDLTMEGINYNNLRKLINKYEFDFILMKKTYYKNSLIKSICDQLEQDNIISLSKIYNKSLITEEYYLFEIDKK